MNKKNMKKLLVLILALTLVLSLGTVSASASTETLLSGYNALFDGGSDSYSFKLDERSKVNINFAGVCSPVAVAGTPFTVDGTDGEYDVYILNSNGTRVYKNPNTSGYSYGYAMRKCNDFTLSTTLNEGSYTLVIKNHYLDIEDYPNAFYYSMNVTSEPAGDSSSSSNSGTTSNNSSTSGTTTPSTNTSSGTSSNSSSTNTSSGTSNNSSSTFSSSSSTSSNSNGTSSSSSTTESTQEDSTDTSVDSTTSQPTITKEAVETNESVTVETETAKVTFDTTALNTMLSKANGVEELTVEVKEITVVDLVEKQSLALDGANVALCISAEVLANGEIVSSDFGGGKATVSIPFEVPNGFDPEDFVVLYLAEDGTIEVKESSYSDGYITVELDHFSTYAVVEADTLDLGTDGLNSYVVFALVIILITTIIGGIFVYKKNKAK